MLHLQLHPRKAVAVRREDTTVAAVWFGPAVLRPFVYPLLAPGDVEVTRLGHPGDPVGHSHHRSVWIGHHDAGGVDFWGESPSSGRIRVTDVDLLENDADEVVCALECRWEAPDEKLVLDETRTLRFIDLRGGELALEIDMTLAPADPEAPVTLGETPFGLLGVRVARTIGVAERLGGLILNSQEAENEKACFWQHAEWCDYSGPVPVAGAEGEETRDGFLRSAVVGVACFDHPGNSPTDTIWHVRDDGWMGPCISKSGPRSISAASPLRARYRLETHAGRPWHARVPERYRRWREKTTAG